MQLTVATIFVSISKMLNKETYKVLPRYIVTQRSKPFVQCRGILLVRVPFGSNVCYFVAFLYKGRGPVRHLP